VLLFTATKVFERAIGATVISPDVGTIIIGVVQMLGAGFSGLLIDRLKRKPLLFFGSLSVAIGMTVFGVMAQLIEHGKDSTFVRIIPVVVLAWAIFMANIGVFSLTFVILSEISPENVSVTTFIASMFSI
jgi:MFS family permease